LIDLAPKFLNALARLVPITEKEDFLLRGDRTVDTALVDCHKPLVTDDN
jgi:hypothetical protein